MEINDQLSIEELLQEWVNLSYKLFYRKEKTVNNIATRKEIAQRLKTKGINNIEINGMDDESYTLEYNHHTSKIIKKIMIKK